MGKKDDVFKDSLGAFKFLGSLSAPESTTPSTSDCESEDELEELPNELLLWVLNSAAQNSETVVERLERGRMALAYAVLNEHRWRRRNCSH